MFHVHGTKDDYDLWANLTEDDDWKGINMRKYEDDYVKIIKPVNYKDDEIHLLQKLWKKASS